MTINGIDVSTFQGAINWVKVKKYNDVQFAMLRGGYGRFGLDARFIQNYNNCKSAGIPVGVYHYSYATTVNKARQEAEFVITYLKDKKLEYPVAYDVEDQSLSTLSGKKLTEIVDTFCSTVEKAGYYVVIYSGKYWFAKMDMKKLSRYDIWLAQWTSKPSLDYPYGMWQYSDKGHITGINTRVDLDKAYKDYPRIIKKVGLNGWNESTSEKPKTAEIGKKLTLVSTPLYTSSNSKTPATSITGTYYVYDGEIINGRVRITPKKEWCLKKPLTGFVTGWIKF